MNSSPTQAKVGGKKLLHIEFLRIVAIWLVLFNHTGGMGYFLFASNLDSIFFPIYIFLSVLDAIDIPLFFMISGALLLGKEESIADIYKKRVVRFVIILLAASVVYYFYNWRFNGHSLSLKGFWTAFYGSNVSIPLWYLYSYIGLLMMLPLLRKMVRGMVSKDYLYLFCCYFLLVGILPTVEYLLGQGTLSLSSDFSAPLLTTYNLFYFIMGYYFEKVMDDSRLNKKALLFGGVLSVLAIAASCCMIMYQARVTGVLSETESHGFHGRLIAIPAFTVYTAAKYYFQNHKLRPMVQRIITTVGSTAFGVYLLQGMILPRTEFVYHYFSPIVKAMPACFIWVTTACATGTILTLILKKVPIIKNFL